MLPGKPLSGPGLYFIYVVPYHTTGYGGRKMKCVVTDSQACAKGWRKLVAGLIFAALVGVVSAHQVADPLTEFGRLGEWHGGGNSGALAPSSAMQAAQPRATQPPMPLRVGTILPLTGVLQAFGLSMRDAADLAAAEIDAAEVLSGSLELLHRDSQTRATAGINAANDLIFTERVPAILGAAASGVSLPVAGVTVPNEVLQISPASTSPVFSTFESQEPGWFWRTAHSDVLEANVAAGRAVAKSWSQAGILAPNSAFGIGLADAFREGFSITGGTIVAQVNYTEGKVDYTADLQLLANAAPQFVFLVGFPGDGRTIVSSWWANRLDPGWDWEWLWYGGLKDQSFVDDLQSGGVDVRGVEGTGPLYVGGPHFSTFSSAYRSAYGSDPVLFAAHAYDALYLLALAAVSGQATDSLSIRSNLLRVASPGGAPVGPGTAEFQRATGILERGEEVDYQGASGSVDFDFVGDVGTAYETWWIDDTGQIQQLQVLPESQVWQPETDLTPPTVALSSPTSGAFLAVSDVSVSWSASDDRTGVAYVAVTLDGGTAVRLPATSSSHTFTGVGDGSHTIDVTAFDFAGNSKIASAEVTVDTIPPTLSLTSPIAETVVTTRNLEVVWTVSDAISGIDRIELTLDGGTPVVVPSPESRTTLADVSDGSHTLTVAAYDRAGNVESASVEFRVDTNPFSPTGPYGIGLLVALPTIGASVAIAGVLLVIRWRRSR